jgi:hypothetical protein
LVEINGDPKKEFFLPLLINYLVVNKTVNTKVINANDSWIGVTYASDKQMASDSIKQLVSEGKYPVKLW